MAKQNALLGEFDADTAADDRSADRLVSRPDGGCGAGAAGRGAAVAAARDVHTHPVTALPTRNLLIVLFI